jgi:hypothetical protein
MKNLTFLFFTLIAFIGNAQDTKVSHYTSDDDHFYLNFLSQPVKTTANGCNMYVGGYGKELSVVRVYQSDSDTAKMGEDKFIDYLKGKYGKKNLDKKKNGKFDKSTNNVKDDNCYSSVLFDEAHPDGTCMDVHVFMHNNKLYYVNYVYPASLMTSLSLEDYMDFCATFFASFKITD